MFDLERHPHRRFNPLLEEWVLVSPHRTDRPWQGGSENAVEGTLVAHDPNCYLCPGSARANGGANPAYSSTYVFANDFPALTQTSPGQVDEDPLFRAVPVTGECRVVCFSPRHDLTLAEMDTRSIAGVVDTWCAQEEELGARWEWVQIFENKGATMGCSNPHPHGQIWASDFVPTMVRREMAGQSRHFESSGRLLLEDVRDEELRRSERVVESTDHWVTIVPFWAVWPFETLLLPKRRVEHLYGLTIEERLDLAEAIRRTLARYDNLFRASFPYSMGWHPSPRRSDGWLLHAHVFPPLLRSALIRKFMVGYEMMAEAQRDITPEHAAAMLRECSTTHFKGLMEGTNSH